MAIYKLIHELVENQNQKMLAQKEVESMSPVKIVVNRRNFFLEPPKHILSRFFLLPAIITVQLLRTNALSAGNPMEPQNL